MKDSIIRVPTEFNRRYTVQSLNHDIARPLEGLCMQEKMYQEFYKELVNRLTDKQFLKNIKLSKKAMLELIQSSEHWKDDMRTIMEKDRVSCRDVLNLCETALSSLSDEPKEGWLHYIYDYILKQLFPGKPSRKSENPHEAGRLFYLEVLRFFLQYEIRNRPFSPRWHMEFLPEDEMKNTDTSSEYRRLLHIIQEQYYYEFMRSVRNNQAQNACSHRGVHYICMHAGRQLPLRRSTN